MPAIQENMPQPSGSARPLPLPRSSLHERKIFLDRLNRLSFRGSNENI